MRPLKLILPFLPVLAGALLLPGTLVAKEQKGIYEPIELGEKAEEILGVVDEMDRRFERRGHVYRDAEALDLIRRVCSSVIPEDLTDDYMDFEFRILRDPMPNAFAMPNGSIYITTGLLARMEDEAHLASICAHEATHVLGRHTVVAMRSHRKKTAGMIAGSMLLSAATITMGGAGGSILQSASGIGLQILYVASVLGYSRELETEADDRAVDAMVQAGYDPNAMIEVFAALARDYEGLAVEKRTFWLDHPKLADRIQHTDLIIANRYPDLGSMGLERGRERYIAAMEGVIRHDVQLQIKGGYPRTAVVMAQGLVERYGDDPENLILLGDAWRALGPLTEEPEPVRLDIDPSEKPKKARKKLREEEQRRQEARRRKTRAERERAALATEQGRREWEEHVAEAEWAYLQALEKDETAVEAWRGLGYLYEKDGRPEDALRAFRAYMKERPAARDRYVIQRHIAAMEEMAMSLAYTAGDTEAPGDPSAGQGATSTRNEAPAAENGAP